MLLNSLKGGKEGRHVSVIAERKEVSHILDSVKDTGIGINPAILPRLFAKFATKCHHQTLEGIGLGLFICKSVIEAHGGRIWADNNKDGKGDTFTFSLPVRLPRRTC